MKEILQNEVSLPQIHPGQCRILPLLWIFKKQDKN